MLDPSIHTGSSEGHGSHTGPAGHTEATDPFHDPVGGQSADGDPFALDPADGAGLAVSAGGDVVGTLQGDATELDDDPDAWSNGAEPATSALFDGDIGTLEDKQRRALVALLKHKFISSATHAAEWKIIRDDQELFRSRLNDMFLELHLDERYEVAFKRRVVGDGVKDFPALLQDLAWTREETLILVYLRNRHRMEQMSGRDDVTIEREEIDDYVKRFRPVHATDRAADETRFRKAVDNLITAKVLQKTNDAERLRISTVIPVLLPVARLKDLQEWLAARNTGLNADKPGTEEMGSGTNAFRPGANTEPVEDEIGQTEEVST